VLDVNFQFINPHFFMKHTTFNPSSPKIQTCVKADLLFKCYKSKFQRGIKISTVQYCSVHVVDGVEQIWGHLTV